MKRILILSYHFIPDLSASSYRTEALLKALLKIDSHLEIDVLTTFPSRYDTYNPKDLEISLPSNITIKRIKTPKLDFGFKGEFFSSIVYFFKAKKYLKNKNYDLVYASTAKLASAWLGRYIAQKKQSKLYIDVRDLFIENVRSMFSTRVKRFILPVLKIIEKQVFSQADKVNVVSPAFAPYLEKYINKDKVSIYCNGIDDYFINVLPNFYHVENQISPLKLVYAGNIGRAQALHKILPSLSLLLGTNLIIDVIGAGRDSHKLMESISALRLTNISLKEPVKRSELISIYKDADILFLHLDSYESLSKVIPSKIFEYAASGKPILCGVGGFTKEFIEKEITNAAVFEPNNAVDAVCKLQQLDLGITQRSEFLAKYSRNKVMANMAEDILSLLSNHSS